MEGDDDDRFARLEARLRQVEDQLEIARLVASYGPAVDSLDAEATTALWSDDGVYDIGSDVWSGREEIAGMVRGQGHGSLVVNGVAHVHSFPRVTVTGDSAVALGYSRIYRWQGDGFAVWRVSANRWDLERTVAGWRCTRRTTRLMDGTGHAVFAPDEPR